MVYIPRFKIGTKILVGT